MHTLEVLLDEICSSPILSLPNSGSELSIDTDASGGQVGVALFQTENDDQRHPIGFWSRILNPAESNYFMPEKECLALVWGLTILRPICWEIHSKHTPTMKP